MCIYIYIYIYVYLALSPSTVTFIICMHVYELSVHTYWSSIFIMLGSLTFTRYCFTSIRLYSSPSFFHSSGPPTLLTLLQYYCMAIGQPTTPPRPPPGMPYAIQCS